jgi:uncharacterized protein YfaS (alpha-2-macroglobulin family)
MSGKKIILFLSLILITLISSAQMKINNYDRSWKKIDSLIDRTGQVKTALKEVNTIYSKAKKEENDAQLIKALIYRANLEEQLTDNDKNKTFTSLEKEIVSAKEPSRSILQSILATSYWNYLQRNRSKFYNRTTTVNFIREDPATWSIRDLNEKIASLYLASVSDISLKDTKLEPYNAIITKGNTRPLRPTLFDLLAHKALDYFKNDERNITKPAYAFEISDTTAFADAIVFAKHAFKTQDSTSLHYQALLIFQQLVTMHLNDQKPGALIDADIERIAFTHDHATAENKNELYASALERIITRYPGNPIAAQAVYLLAASYTAKAATYDPLKDTTFRYAYLKAKDLCEKALTISDSSEGRSNCINLLKQITRKEIKTEAEQVNIPGQPFRVSLTYRNVPTAYFRIIKLDAAIKQKIGSDQWSDPFWQQLIKIPYLSQFSNNLPDTKDYQHHRVEIKTAALAPGEYALITSAEKNFILKENALALHYFYVSNIAYISRNNDYYILDRQTGAPLPGAGIQVWKEQYNYQKKQNILVKDARYTADKNGFFQAKDTVTASGNFSKLLDISYSKDRLFINEEIYSYDYQGITNAPKSKPQAFLFTDRSIYRPGQLLHFKGIVVNRDKSGKPEVFAHHSSTIKLYDANEQVVDSLLLTTNEFGSYSGKFNLSSGQLNGEFHIKDEEAESQAGFRVEEYKRPGFSVELKKPGGTYRLQDTIQVEGIATSYAGNNIDGAIVNYCVTRKTNMPFYMDYARIFPPNRGAQMEITHGTTTTGANGKFVIPFKAIPDNSIPSSQDPLFNYEVTADITDINGETRSANSNVSVGYRVLQIILNVPASLRTDSLKELNIVTTNLNGVFEKALVTISIQKISAPVKVFRERYWKQPDQFIFKKEDYYKNFPHDLYSDENDITKWPVEKTFFETSGTTSPDTSFGIKGVNFKPGWYLIEVSSKDKFDNPVKEKRFIRLDDNAIVSSFATAAIQADRPVGEPGDKINYRLITNLDSAYVIHQLIRNNKEQKEIISLSENSFSKEITVTGDDQPDIYINMAFIKNNRIYAEEKLITVPYFNKELTIGYTTFRDKTLPGTPEKWKVKIGGYKGEKIAAELLMSMYDASLDQFKPHSWTEHSLWPISSRHDNWSGNANFKMDNSFDKSFGENDNETFDKEYDQLLAIENGMIYNAASGGRMLVRGMAMEKSEVEKFTAPSLAKDEARSDTVVSPRQQPSSSVLPRKNLQETAFFLPDLHTDSSGNIEFSFITPEALTTWKWMLLAHTKDLAFGYGERTMITQKQLMVQPNAPRFLRQGDELDLTTKIVNITDKDMSGTILLELENASTGKKIDTLFNNILPSKTFSAKAGQSIATVFRIRIPRDFTDPVSWRFIATSGSLSDGEEAILPVVSNRMLVTETLPLPMRGNATKKFSFEKLLKSGNSSSLQQKGISVEFTSNPAWYAIQALPYLTEGDKENAEQLFNRYYANALASSVAESSPHFKEIIEKWKTSDTAAMLSNLQKNEELKSALLRETPWVLEAKTEAQQKKNIALLFDITHMSSTLSTALIKLKDMQAPTGGFVWFKGGREDRYMTQYILSGIGHLEKLGAVSGSDKQLQSIINPALSYLDKQVKKDYEELGKFNKTLPLGSINNIIAQYLYMRSFFTEAGVPGEVFAAYNYYRNQSKTAWVKQNTFTRGMIALSLFRTGDVQNAQKIMKALNETSITNDELGMYWKDMNGGYYWYESPVEALSLLIETFSEITKDTSSINDMKTWLLKNKQTNNWKTTRATADACYALLLQGSDWTTNEPAVDITLGNTTISSGKDAEAGTGYFKQRIDEVKPLMGNISVRVSSAGKAPSWGSIYWQYFEDLDKITAATTPLQLSKKIFIEKNTDRGPLLQPLDMNNTVHIGDKIKVRIELRSDRTMEYVHMKDMRASCLEPVSVLSEYKWQGGLGYYESTKDESTDFFFGTLPKGVYVFEYTLIVSVSGSFSNGVTTIQCMYAPEFTSHSEGINLHSENK